MKFTNLSEIPPEHTQDPDELTLPTHHYTPNFESHANLNRLYLEEKVLPTLVPCLEKLLILVEEEQRAEQQEQDLEQHIQNLNASNDSTSKKSALRRTPRRHDQYSVTTKSQKMTHANTESQFAKRDPLNWLAMTLMRTNLKYSDELKNHPYTKEISKHTQVLKESLKPSSANTRR
mmetsp:Transcript_1560/g.5366  ORF Transcript_1560/g.5366 Transcript_1560/m.5366 type:complete len:176 (-) Transcript_1560:75-602(-)|eukprot:CAMPEP_0117445802 /NCGR_PEP_ID=MMETSP0759-20121206/5992_1 /TAXON_ID=63605 /ORGANISM="Percolomonas cosmopolitus, Strain WS" /LENGTH=175 /DNA_ID=CAMNT_0005238007 /DNA_START=283 /DNA_END=810 /DNA_ORIENTATION=-